MINDTDESFTIEQVLEEKLTEIGNVIHYSLMNDDCNVNIVNAVMGIEEEIRNSTDRIVEAIKLLARATAGISTSEDFE